jgi:hypothetical protein
MFIKSTAIKLLCVAFSLQYFTANAQNITVVGTMGLGALNKISDASNINMNGGILSTGSGGGFSETVGTLTLSDNSTITLGTGSHNLNFAVSDGTSWTAGTVLTITGWQGAYDGTAGTSGKIFTGSSAELSTGKKAQIRFTNPGNGSSYTATQLGTGEVVPLAIALPIELLSFKAKLNNKVVLLNWQTATETNNDYFEIERSVDGKVWESIDTIKGAGNSSNVLNYAINDEKPLLGSSYYRLKQVDFDKKISYSDIAVVNFEGFKIIDLFPNPSNGNINIVIQSSVETSVDLKIYNAIGQILKSETIQVSKGVNHIQNHFEGPTGKYFISAKTSDGAYYDYKFILKN